MKNVAYFKIITFYTVLDKFFNANFPKAKIRNLKNLEKEK